MRKPLVSLLIFLIALFYEETAIRLFGRHFLPASFEELITDGIALIIVAFGLSALAK